MSAAQGQQPSVEHQPERSRFEVRLGDREAGFAEYVREGEAVRFTHTVVDPAFEGHGLGSLLVREAVDWARGEGADVLPQCTFVRAWVGRHPDALALVPADRREQYGLPPR